MINTQVHENENRRHDEHWDRGGAFMDDFQTHNWLELGSRWFRMLSFKGLVQWVRYVFTNLVRPGNMYNLPQIDTEQQKYYFPIRIRDSLYHPVIFDVPMSEDTKKEMEVWKDHVAEHPNQQF